jgi:hypothetical protein
MGRFDCISKFLICYWYLFIFSFIFIFNFTFYLCIIYICRLILHYHDAKVSDYGVYRKARCLCLWCVHSSMPLHFCLFIYTNTWFSSIKCVIDSLQIYADQYFPSFHLWQSEVIKKRTKNIQLCILDK